MPETCPADHKDGPILDFLSQVTPFDAIHLLYDPPKDTLGAVSALTAALKLRSPGASIKHHLIPVDDPRRYSDLYRYLRAACEAVEIAHPNASFHILLSPGTSQVHAIWVLLSKTVFPATTWQTSDLEGAARAEVVEIPFDVQAELIGSARECSASGVEPLDIPDFISRSEAMVRAVREVAHIAKNSEAPLLLLGETGVGKERVARYAHSVSARKAGRFLGVNCGALPSHLIESTLFGHVRGAFTGADRDQEGLFEAASTGTLFLDEVGELALDAQATLLRVLQERTLRRVGSASDISVNPRIIAATHQDLRKMIEAKQFRADLYYRLSMSVEIPPLRARLDDIAFLAEHFLAARNEARRARDQPALRLSASAVRALEGYAWPGNVRELENTMERVALFGKNAVLGARELHELVPSLATTTSGGHATNLNAALDDLARKMILQALEHHGTQKAAAQALGLSSDSALQNRMKTLGITHTRSRRRGEKGK